MRIRGWNWFLFNIIFLRIIRIAARDCSSFSLLYNVQLYEYTNLFYCWWVWGKFPVQDITSRMNMSILHVNEYSLATSAASLFQVIWGKYYYSHREITHGSWYCVLNFRCAFISFIHNCELRVFVYKTQTITDVGNCSHQNGFKSSYQ